MQACEPRGFLDLCFPDYRWCVLLVSACGCGRRCSWLSLLSMREATAFPVPPFLPNTSYVSLGYSADSPHGPKLCFKLHRHEIEMLWDGAQATIVPDKSKPLRRPLATPTSAMKNGLILVCSITWQYYFLLSKLRSRKNRRWRSRIVMNSMRRL